MSEDAIRSVPLFASLPQNEIQRLSQCFRPREVPAKTILLQEGMHDPRYYILIKGEVEIIKSMGQADERVLAVRQAPSFMGEMSLFSEDGRHTASVRSITELELLELERDDLDGLLRRHPDFAYEMLRTLSLRLDESENLTIRDLRRKNRELMQAYEDLEAAQVQIVEKEKLERELEVARQIQTSILPRSFPLITGYDFGAMVVPMTAVGGDFYDFINLDEKSIGIAIGDVTDHGVGSALLMALTVTLLRAESRRETSPREVLLRINRHLLEMDDTGMFVTMLYGILDFQSREFTYARAGHEVPIIVDTHGKAIELEYESGQPVGLFSDPLLDERRLKLTPGSLLFLYSDGATDACDVNGNMYGLDRLRTTLCGCHTANAMTICESTWESLIAHRCGEMQQDDVTLLTVKVE